MLVTVQFQTFASRLPAFHEFFSLANALWLSVTLAVIKVLHEFGHGLTCKHFGGECHEVGVMVLVLTPCLYCNVSDSWMLPNKWHRAAIGAGGMYVELILAAIATFIWWFSQPGLLNHLCLNAMFVASVTTIIFNANPLLRYDGYYILADLTEIPNLRQKATTILSRKMGEWCLGLEYPDDPFLPERNQVFFALYSIAAAIYRWVVVFSILFFLYKIFKPYRLERIGQAIALASLWGLLGMPLWQLGKFFYVPGRLDKVKKPRMYASIAIVVGLILAVTLIPLPHSVTAVLEVQPRDAEQVYVNVAEGGQLLEVKRRSGKRVAQGDVLAVLQNHDLDLEVLRLKAKRDLLLIQMDNLRRQAAHDPKAAGQISELADSLEAIKSELAKKEEDRKRLSLVTEREGGGIVLPPPPTPPPHQEDPDGPLPSWTGTPLDPENRYAYLKEGTLFCQVGDPRKLEAILVIDQADIEFIHEGQEVDLNLDEIPHDTLHGQIDRISLSNMKITPRRLSTKSQGELASKTDPTTGVESPQSPSYQARVPLDDEEGALLSGLRGRAKIHTRPLSLGARLWRYVIHTFNFKL
jgi:putative peptide zinc metalloprotease protein